MHAGVEATEQAAAKARDLKLVANVLLESLIRDGKCIRCDFVKMHAGDVLQEFGQPIEHVFFPLGGLACLASVVKNGDMVANALIGSEGVVGFGREKSLVRSMVLVPGRAARVTVDELRKAALFLPFKRSVAHFNELLVGQIQQTVACVSLHSLDQRLCFWLTNACERVRTNELPITQAILSKMLGVHRASINSAMMKLQSAGAISYSRRGYITVDRDRAVSLSCECYEHVSS